MTANLQSQRMQLLDNVLLSVPKLGWCQEAIEEASKKAGHDSKYAQLLFMGGVDDLIDLYFDRIDGQMMNTMKECELGKLKVPDRVYLAIVTRLHLLKEYKAVVARTISYLSLPWNLSVGLRLSWRTMDLIWYELCNDQSTDYNYYTKRGLLLSVYTSTLFYWISDESPDFADTKAFLRDRLANVASLGKVIGSIKNCKTHGTE